MGVRAARATEPATDRRRSPTSLTTSSLSESVSRPKVWSSAAEAAGVLGDRRRGQRPRPRSRRRAGAAIRADRATNDRAAAIGDSARAASWTYLKGKRARGWVCPRGAMGCGGFLDPSDRRGVMIPAPRPSPRRPVGSPTVGCGGRTGRNGYSRPAGPALAGTATRSRPRGLCRAHLPVGGAGWPCNEPPNPSRGYVFDTVRRYSGVGSFATRSR